MPKLYETAIKPEKAILIGVTDKDTSVKQLQEYLDELAFLIETAGAIPTKRFTQNLDYAHPQTYLGSGKLDEVAKYLEDLPNDEKIDLAVFDDELSPTQIRNIQNVLKCRILDRTNLILDIFARRAKSTTAKTQVELAQYQYILPRLTRMWTHLERQRGGIGLRGPGETELETDRRVVREKIDKLKEILEKIDKQKTQQRLNRTGLVRVALVGYTNVGKSTLMNVLSKSDVFAENKLFATLDTTVRKVVYNDTPYLLTDTVGFIRKLPHHLVESFKSTLDEVREADILIHIVDISHPNFEEQLETVNKTLSEIAAGDKHNILVFNKIDAFSYIQKQEDDLTPKEKTNFSLEELQNSWMAKSNVETIFISAKQGTNLEQLKDAIFKKVFDLQMNKYPLKYN